MSTARSSTPTTSMRWPGIARSASTASCSPSGVSRDIGMGGDQLVVDLADADVERRLGDSIRARESDCYGSMIGEVEAMKGASELLGELHARGHAVILASSASRADIERYVDLLGARKLADAWTSADDVSATKPAPDLVNAALELADAEPAQAVMVGDSPWDVLAAQRVGVPTLGVIMGFRRRALRRGRRRGLRVGRRARQGLRPGPRPGASPWL